MAQKGGLSLVVLGLFLLQYPSLAFEASPTEVPIKHSSTKPLQPNLTLKP